MVFAEKAVQCAPSNGEARANLGMVYEAIDRNDEAIDQYLIAMELLDDAEEVMVKLASILIKERRFQEAANTADALVKLAPSAVSYTQLGRAQFKLGSYDRSHRSWEPQMRFFSRRYRCVTLAARGFPPSDVPGDVAMYSQAVAVADIIAAPARRPGADCRRPR